MEWKERADLFQGSTLTWPEACIIILLVSFTEPGQTIAPRTVGVCVSAVKKFLQNNGVDTKFMDNSQYIRNTKAGLAQLYRIKTNRTDADRERISITSDMIRVYYVYDGGANLTLPQMAVSTAASNARIHDSGARIRVPPNRYIRPHADFRRDSD